MEEQGEFLVGQSVRISDSAGASLPSAPVSSVISLDDRELRESAAVAGEQGLCVKWEPEENVHLVATFSGTLVEVPAGCLEVAEPPLCEDGGYDLIWPVFDYTSVDELGYAALEIMEQKGYCVIQTFTPAEETKDASANLNKGVEQMALSEELAADYLGQKFNKAKLYELEPDTLDRDVSSNSISRLDRQLTTLGLALAGFSEEMMGFEVVGRSRTLCRRSFKDKAEAAKFELMPLSDEDVEEGQIKQHLSFLRGRSVCMMYMLQAEVGGRLHLLPRGEGGSPAVALPITENKIIIFRHDEIDYQYEEVGQNLVLQSWALKGDLSIQVSASSVTGAPEKVRDLFNLIGVPPPEADQVQIESMVSRYAGMVVDWQSYESMLMAGCDSCIHWPKLRADEDMYYTPDPDLVHVLGRSYTNHGSFCEDDMIMNFDNHFFGIVDDEANSMTTNARIWLEVGYETLHKASYRKKDLKGSSMGVYIGDCGADWAAMTGLFAALNYHGDYTATAIHNAVTCCRLSYVFDMVGPSMNFDTACSASLYATHHAHMQMINMKRKGLETPVSLCGGTNTIGPSGYVGNSMGNILSHIGRCQTFDGASDGYNRGEGAGGFVCKLTDSAEVRAERWAAIMGSASNHDGKSASLTAPSGPAQQKMIRFCMTMAGLEPDDYSFTQLHGTGTALGDPIEIGAVAAVLGERETVLPHTTPKTHLSHCESAAGASCVIKLLAELQFMVVDPNIHFRVLNPHLETEGLPRIFTSEATDTGCNSGYAGTSSFGFAGANARVDFWAKATAGPKAAVEMKMDKFDVITQPCPKCLGPMCFVCGAAVPSLVEAGKHVCTLIRGGSSRDYEFCSTCYEGSYRYGSEMRDTLPWTDTMTVLINGTWNGLQDAEEMEQIEGEDGQYSCTVVLGESRLEYFNIMVHGSAAYTLYPPPSSSGQQDTRVMGPDAGGEGVYWMIDGVADGAQPGTVYRINLTWSSDSTATKSISWAVETANEVLPETIMGSAFNHKYFVQLPWGSQEMLATDSQKGVYEATVTLTMTEPGDFTIMRDKLPFQQLYPPRSKATDSQLAIRGPGANPSKCGWRLVGNTGDRISIKLEVLGEGIGYSLDVINTGGFTSSWKSEPFQRHAYYVSGSFNKWRFSKMTPDVNSPRIYHYTLALNPEDNTPFRIAVDKDHKQAIYPALIDCPSGYAITQGPDNEAGERCWLIPSDLGTAVVEITLDFNQEDKRNIVTWQPVGEVNAIEGP